VSNYTAKDITVLEGLEPVRRRPGMYIGGVGSTGLHHLVWEILDNSIDEAMNGHASNILVALHKDSSSLTVQDDGRGIPVDKHPHTKTSALEVIFTTLHAGGKFEGPELQDRRRVARCRRVGRECRCRASSWPPVRRDGATWEAKFKQGVPVGSVKEARPGARHGHDRLFQARSHHLSEDPVRRGDDSRTARSRELPPSAASRLGSRTRRRRRGRARPRRSFSTRKGLGDYLKKILAERRANPVHEQPFALCPRARGDGLRIDLVLRWTEATDEHLRSYANGIPTWIGRHARERPARRHRQGDSELHRHAQSLAEGRDAHGRRHTRGARRRAERLSSRSRSSRDRRRTASTIRK
jgi:DNA gyrase subunit B/topoisomerase-4 subunit B